MEKGFEYMQHEFSAVRTGKASPALVENIDVVGVGLGLSPGPAVGLGPATTGGPASW